MKSRSFCCCAGVQAVVEGGHRLDRLRAGVADGVRLLVDQGLRACLVELRAGNHRQQFAARVGGAADDRVALLAQRVEQVAQPRLLRLVEFQFLADALDDAFAPLGGILAAPLRRLAVMVPVAAGRDAADQQAGAEQSNQRALDPGFHRAILSGIVPWVEGVAMVRGTARGVLSRRFRHVSFLVTTRLYPPWHASSTFRKTPPAPMPRW